MVQNDRSHANERPVADFGSVNRHVVPDGYIVANFDGRFLIQRVQNGTVLYVDAVADSDGIDISPQHCVEPDAATVTNFDIAHNRGIVC